jgi:TM2 domain-containing membrane protein YozV
MEVTRPTEDWNKPQPPQQENKKIVAGIFALLLGSIGVHKFYLGYTTEGIIQIIISVVTCGIGGIIPFIEGIIYLVKSDEEFYQTYQVGKKGWF